MMRLFPASSLMAGMNQPPVFPSKRTRGSVERAPPSTGPKKVSKVTSKDPRTPPLLKILIRLLVQTRNWVGPAAPSEAGGVTMVAGAESPLKRVPATCGVSGPCDGPALRAAAWVACRTGAPALEPAGRRRFGSSRRSAFGAALCSAARSCATVTRMPLRPSPDSGVCCAASPAPLHSIQSPSPIPSLFMLPQAEKFEHPGHPDLPWNRSFLQAQLGGLAPADGLDL